ncbi:MAG: rRNA methyltransferase [Cyclobacteriaceae bacterium]|nr:MAG: rRNA methyltransferase [Cyclobacteriaceae bacterium]
MKSDGLITSIQNPKIKSLLALEKPRERKRQQLFVIEGRKEIALALQAGYQVGNIFYCEELISRAELESLQPNAKFLVRVSRQVFEKIAVRGNSGGVVAIAGMKVHRLENLALSANPLLVILDRIEKPGNLGAILRTADAAGVDAVICCDAKTDFYNPNVIRSSLGCVFTLPMAMATATETIAWLRQKGCRIYCTWLEASIPYTDADFTQPCAIVLGAEATGVSGEWIAQADANIIIPMQGRADSLNVSVSAAVVVFEARRQRSLKAPGAI